MAFHSTSSLDSHPGTAAVANLDKLLISELNASQTWGLEQLDLGLDQQVKCNLGHKQGWPRSSRVADGSANIVNTQVFAWVDRVQCRAKDVIKDVVDPGTTAQLLCRNLGRSSIDGSNKIACESGQQLKDKRALIEEAFDIYD